VGWKVHRWTSAWWSNQPSSTSWRVAVRLYDIDIEYYPVYSPSLSTVIFEYSPDAAFYCK
jgi:hypothetical protein